MKRAIYILTVLLLTVLLTGCQCKHEWADANCEAPKTCAKCGETEGEALGHTWVEATCVEAKHCTICGKAEGDPLPHTLTEANYQQAATCTVCGAEVGEPLEAYFEKMGAEINVTELHKSYKYVNERDGYTSVGRLYIDKYETFPSDETHEARDGYEWKRVQIRFIFPKTELEHGARVSWHSMSYYNKSSSSALHPKEGEQVVDHLNWYGEECEYTSEHKIVDNRHDSNGAWIFAYEFEVQLPVDCDDIVITAYHKTPAIEAKANAGEPITDDILKAEDSLFFRLD